MPKRNSEKSVKAEIVVTTNGKTFRRQVNLTDWHVVQGLRSTARFEPNPADQIALLVKWGGVHATKNSIWN